MRLAATPDAPVARRLATLLAGLVLVALGISLMITAEIGVASFDVLNTGIAELTGLDIGVAAVVNPLIWVAVGWAIGGRVGPGTLLAIPAVGPILGVLLDVLPDVDALAPRLALFAVGFVILSAGVTGVIIAEIGPGPAELVMLAIHEKGYPLAPVRTALEAFSVAIGWAMGGQVGAGTVVVALVIGPTLRWMLSAAGYDSTRAAEASDRAAPGA